MSLIRLANLPKFIRERLSLANDLPSKRELSLELSSLIEDFFSNHSLNLETMEVRDSYLDIPEWRIDTVLAKLRSLIEQKAKKEVRLFCSGLDEKRKKNINLLLRQAGIYTFREAIELDLYVGIHTAISAYFKMIGLALKLSKEQDIFLPLSLSTKELFKTLKFVATLPLRHLMAFDGLFWDSKQYFIPSSFQYEISEDGISYLLPESEIILRLSKALADEQQFGCPALRARNNFNVPIFDLIEKVSLETTEKYYLNYSE